MILGKSNHPIEIKKIPLRVWSLRDEIEKAIESIIELKDTPEYQTKMQEIKAFYSNNVSEEIADSGSEKESKLSTGEDSEMDDDMAAMADALNEDSEAESETDSEQSADGEASEDGESEAQDSSGEQIIIRSRAIPDEDKLSYGHTFLADINMDSVLLFSKHPYTIGQSIVIEFLIPHRFTLSAEVFNCKNFSMNSKIINEARPEYRVKADLKFLQPGERTALREFLKSIEPEIPPPPKRVAKSEDDEDDDSDDLSDFGF